MTEEKYTARCNCTSGFNGEMKMKKNGSANTKGWRRRHNAGTSGD